MSEKELILYLKALGLFSFAVGLLLGLGEIFLGLAFALASGGKLGLELGLRRLKKLVLVRQSSGVDLRNGLKIKVVRLCFLLRR